MFLDRKKEPEVDENKVDVVVKNSGTIYLSFLKLRRLPPKLWDPQIVPLETIRQLELSCNYLETLPPEITHLANLEGLHAGVNALTRLSPELSRLSRLTTLNLCRNSISSFPTCILSLSSLRSLNLSFNSLKELPDSFGSSLSSLTSLVLANNHITAFPSGVQHMTALKELDLSINQIPAIPPELGLLPRLERFDIGCNDVSAFPASLPTSLQVLSLHTNHIGAIPPSATSLKLLLSLDMSYNDLTVEALNAPLLQAVLTHLKSINISGNAIPETYHLPGAPSVPLLINRNTAASRILPGLFLGNWDASRNKYMMKQLGITHVVCVAHDIKPSHPRDFSYLVISIDDLPHEDIRSHFDEAHLYIRQALTTNGTVLVHCAAGISRSATIVISFLMREHRKSYLEAHRLVQEARPIICPNPGFVKQLQSFEEQLAAEQDKCLLM